LKSTLHAPAVGDMNIATKTSLSVMAPGLTGIAGNDVDGIVGVLA